LGLQAGVNLAEISMDPEQTGFEMGIRTGFLVGGIVNYNFSPLLSLQAEPAYIQKGSSVDITSTEDGINIKGEATMTANYIDIPVLLKATFGNAQVKPFLLAGASIAFLLEDVKLNIDKVTANGQDVTNMLPAEQKEETLKTKSTDFVLNLGGGVMIPVGHADIFIEGQYNLGLTDISDEPDDNTEAKNKGIQIKAGVLFPL
ncbi:MAG: porin family protein, partial [Ignavibacteria bacterium]